MKLRKAIKRIAALGVGTAFIGATMLGAASAATLADYPSPFIGDGAFSGVLVVGDKAAAEDLGATLMDCTRYIILENVTKKHKNASNPY